MKRLNDFKRLSNATCTFCNTDRLSGEQSKAVIDLIDMMKEIVLAGQHQPAELHDTVTVTNGKIENDEDE